MNFSPAVEGVIVAALLSVKYMLENWLWHRAWFQSGMAMGFGKFMYPAFSVFSGAITGLIVYPFLSLFWSAFFAISTGNFVLSMLLQNHSHSFDDRVRNRWWVQEGRVYRYISVILFYGWVVVTVFLMEHMTALSDLCSF